jgi:glycosyltransferase involved in cell wall biosynthesis
MREAQNGAGFCVLQVHPCDAMGGTELMVVELAEQLGARGIPTQVATLALAGPIAAMHQARGVPVFSLGGRGGIVGASVRLGSLLKREQYALVNVYGFKASMVVRLLVRMLRLRTVVVCGVQGLHVTEVEDLSSLKSRVAGWLERLLSSFVDVYEANSRGAVTYLAGMGIAETKLRYIPNGIDIASWGPQGPSQPTVPTILCTARFVARKRQRDLIVAIALLLGRGLDCRAVLAGEGPTRPACQRLAREQGVADRIDFPGSVDVAKTHRLLEEASVFCLPSTWEGMPAVILEAMAQGVPVVGTAVNGTEDLVRDGCTGRLVPARDPERLADALESILTSATKAASFVAAARQLVEREYRIERTVDLKRSLYLEMLGFTAPSTAGPRPVP